jgi:hypothetical protein
MDYLDQSDETKWVHLLATRLKKFNNNYKRYLHYLEEQDILIINPSYLKSKYTKGYRIAPEYYDGEPVRIPIENDWIIRQKVIKLKQEHIKKLQKTEKECPHLTKWFNPKLVIDKEGALRQIDRLYPIKQSSSVNRRIALNPKDGRFKALRAVERLANREFYYKVDENIGRLHTNFTNIKKELRSFIKYDGKRLVNLDLKNSQPLFSGMLLRKAFYEDGETFNIHSIPNLNTLLKTKSDSISSILSSAYYIMLGVSAESPAWREFEQYLDIVQSGRFYEEMHELLYPNEPFDRARMKETIFIMFFADNRHGPELRKLEAPFKAKFPTVYSIFSALKRKNKRILSHILQRTESKLIIEIVTRRIAAENPHIPLFTIHDSIATTEEHVEYVEGVIKEEMKKLTGLNACIGREEW